MMRAIEACFSGRLLLAGLALVLLCPISAAMEFAWVRDYADPDTTNLVTAMTADAEGNVYVTGLTWSPATNDDYLTLKYSPTGDLLWMARYNGEIDYQDTPKAIAVDGEGNVLVTGISMVYAGGSNNYDYATIKYDSEGRQQWVAYYGGPAYEEPSSIAVDASGNVYVTGRSQESIGSDNDFATVKYDSDGREDWVCRFDRGGEDSAVDVGLAPEALGGWVYVAGWSEGVQTGADYVIVKYHSGGTEEWARSYDGPAHSTDVPRDMAVDIAGNVCVAGLSHGDLDPYPSDYAIIKYDPTGELQWAARYNGPDDREDEATAVTTDGALAVYVTGRSINADGTGDYATLRYGADGQEEWVSRYTSPANVWGSPVDAAVDDLGYVYVGGSSFGEAAFNEFAVVVYDAEGWERATGRYASPTGACLASGMAIHRTDPVGVYIAGQCEASPGSNRRVFSTVKFVNVETSSVGGRRAAGSAGIPWSLQRPNPFRLETTIAYEVPSNAMVTVRIFDVLGQCVKTLAHHRQAACLQTVIWDGSDDFGNQVESGVYFCHLDTGRRTRTHKIMRIR